MLFGGTTVLLPIAQLTSTFEAAAKDRVRIGKPCADSFGSRFRL